MGNRFDSFDLDVNVTPQAALEALANGDYLRGLVMSFRLNSKTLSRRIFEDIPVGDIVIVVKSIPEVYLSKLIRLVVVETEAGPHLEFGLKWLEAIMTSWGRLMKDRKLEFAPEMRAITRAIGWIERELRKLSENNGYMLEYLLKQNTVNENHDATVDTKMDHDGAGSEVTDEASEESSEGWIGLD